MAPVLVDFEEPPDFEPEFEDDKSESDVAVAEAEDDPEFPTEVALSTFWDVAPVPETYMSIQLASTT
jgi:hypothetical protein